MTNAEARCNKSLRPRKPEGSLGRTAQDVHLDSHTAPELCGKGSLSRFKYSPCRILRNVGGMASDGCSATVGSVLRSGTGQLKP